MFSTMPFPIPKACRTVGILGLAVAGYFSVTLFRAGELLPAIAAFGGGIANLMVWLAAAWAAEAIEEIRSNVRETTRLARLGRAGDGN